MGDLWGLSTSVGPRSPPKKVASPSPTNSASRPAQRSPGAMVDMSQLWGLSTTVGQRPSSKNSNPSTSPGGGTNSAGVSAKPGGEALDSPAPRPATTAAHQSDASKPATAAAGQSDAPNDQPASTPPGPLKPKPYARRAAPSPGAPIPESTLSGEERLRSGLRKGIDFKELGVGGADAQLGQIFRRVFASRSAPPELVKQLGIRHVKGLLLHGPPGTGKTLIARQLARALNVPKPLVVNGPDIFQRFVGQSEENIRELFAPAERDSAKFGDASPLHVIIFDEIDACMKVRSGAGNSGTGTVVHDNVVNQLLVKLDGVQRLNNVLVVGITNRPDLLDPALLRPGRLEVKVEVGLPDAQGRTQILEILSKTMSSHNAMGPDVDLRAVAEATKNFSGAELEGVINSATSFALERAMKLHSHSSSDADDGPAALPTDTAVKVEMQDFWKALREVLPALGTRAERLQEMMPHGMSPRGEEFQKVQLAVTRFARRLTRGAAKAGQGVVGPVGQVTGALLTGRGGVGKTALAAYVGTSSDAPLVQVLSPEALVGKPEQEVTSALLTAFQEAWRSPTAVLILDDLERLLAFSEGSLEHHRQALHTLHTLLKQRPPNGNRLLVLGTTGLEPRHLEYLRMVGKDAGGFQVALEVPALNVHEARALIKAHPHVNPSDVEDIVDMLQLEDFHSSGVPIKHLFTLLDMAWEMGHHETQEKEMSISSAQFASLDQIQDCLCHMRAAGLLQRPWRVASSGIIE